MPRRIEKIREAGVNELNAQQKELTEQIFRLRFQLTTGQAEALKRLREARKDLARVKTLLRAQELTASPRAEKSSASARHESAATAARPAKTSMRSHDPRKAK
jgi:large subunit ribosomal protein L29